jgi:flagellar hook-associated protein 2
MSGTVSSLGVGSGIDTATIVSKLMALEQGPLNTLKSQEAAFNTKLSIYGQLKSALSNLQTAAKALADPTKMGGLAATVLNSNVLSAKADFYAAPGTYTIKVSQLATAQKTVLAAQTSGTTFGSGTLKLTVGGEDTEIALNGGSLNDIRSAINAANTGVTATVVSGVGGDRLVLSGSNTGDAGAFTFKFSGDASLSGLNTLDATVPQVAAQNAKLTVDGVPVESSSNTLTTALTGMTLNLSQIGETTVTVGQDPSRIADAVSAFAKAYNDVVNLIKTNSTYDSKTQTSKPLNAESTARSVLDMLNDARNQAPDGLGNSLYQSLASLGISVTQDGLMTVNDSKLKDALSAATGDVQKTLGAFGKIFSDKVDQMIGKDGGIANRVDSLNRSIKLSQNDQEKMQMRLDALQKRYEAQFTALDTLMSSLQTTSSYLTQQLASLNNNR